jgi:hypothetical protein
MTSAPTSERHRRKAEECERLAQEATIPAFKERYLELAQSWRVLAGKADAEGGRERSDVNEETVDLDQRIAAFRQRPRKPL